MKGVASRRPAQSRVQLDRPSSPGRSRWVSLSLTLLLPLALVPSLVRLPALRVGDGVEYLVQVVSVAEYGTIRVQPEHFERLETLAREDGAGVVSSIGLTPNVDGSLEPLHFWLMAVMAAPFYHVARFLGLGFQHAYTLLFITLFMSLLELARRAHGLRGVIAAWVLSAFSPMLWFVNKAHTEFLTFVCVTATVILLMSNRVLPAAFVLSVAATQNSALAPLALALLVFSVLLRVRSDGWNLNLSFGEVGCLIGTLAALAISPVYYLARFGTPSLLVSRGFADVRTITPQKLIGIFVDPDLGLYPNWPLGALIVLVSASLLLSSAQLRGSAADWLGRRKALLVFATLFLTFLPLVHASQPNFNSGATIHILRYATWYIGLHYVLLYLILTRSIAGAPATRRGAVVVGLAAVPLAWWNVRAFWPGLNEVYMTPSPVRRAGGRLVNLYDQHPEVFLERATGIEMTGLTTVEVIDPVTIPIDNSNLAARGIWAVGSPDCLKLLVFPTVIGSADARPDLKPLGCETAVDAPRLFAYVKSKGLTEPGYLRLDPQTLEAFLPELPLHTRVELFQPAAASLLRRGWYGPEAGWRWSAGRVSELQFRLSEKEADEVRGRALTLRFDLIPYVEPGKRREATFFLNDKEIGRYASARAGHLVESVAFFARAPEDGRFRIRIEIANPSKPGPHDQREIGIAAVAMTLEIRE
jgi:hypothetical protein